MSVTAVWDNAEKTVIRWIFNGKCTMEDLAPCIQFSNQLAAEVNHTVDFIFDLGSSGNLPDNMLTDPTAKSLKLVENGGVSVLVDPDSFIRTVFNLINKMYNPWNNEFWVASSLEEAREMLAKRRATQQEQKQQ